MPRHLSRRSLSLTLLILLPLPALALLCRGHTPSRFDPANLPPWERKLRRTAKHDPALKGLAHRRKPLRG